MTHHQVKTYDVIVIDILGGIFVVQVLSKYPISFGYKIYFNHIQTIKECWCSDIIEEKLFYKTYLSGEVFTPDEWKARSL